MIKKKLLYHILYFYNIRYSCGLDASMVVESSVITECYAASKYTNDTTNGVGKWGVTIQ